MKKRTIYELTTQDVQLVADEEIDRKLQPDELEQIAEKVAEKIRWYDIIADAIKEVMDSNTHYPLEDLYYNLE